MNPATTRDSKRATLEITTPTSDEPSSPRARRSYTGKWWAVVPSEMPATQALLDKSREKVERGVALLADKLEVARAKV